MTTERVPGPAGQGTTRRVIRKNLVFIGAAYVVGALAAFATQAVMARELGRSIFGEYIAALSLVMVLGELYEIGATGYLARETARDPRRLAELLGDMVVTKAVTIVVVAAVAVGLGSALGFSDRELAIAAILAMMLGANAIAKTFRAGLQGLEHMAVASSLAIANAVITAAGMIAIVATGHGLVAAVAFSAVVSVALVPASWLGLRRHAAVPLRGSLNRILAVVRDGFPFTALTVLTFATSYADVMIIRALLGPAETGTYGAAYRLFVVLQFLPAIYLDSIYRAMSHLSHHEPEEFRALVERSAAALFALGLPLAAGGAVLAEPIVTLVFGGVFSDAAGAFRVLLISLPLSFPVWALIAAITMGDRPRSAALLVGPVLALNILANLWLVPDHGIVASAWITLATDACIAFGATAILRRQGVVVRWLRMGAPALPAAALVAATAHALRDLSLVVPIAAGALVYTVAILASGLPARLGLSKPTWALLGRSG
jgi:O-antigen/teichoic acid export membrane protein